MTSATVSSTTTTFAYRGHGLRNSRTTAGNTTTFTWDIAAGLPVVMDDGNQYVYGAGLEQMVVSGSRYYYLADGLGSTMAIVDSTGAVQKSYSYDVYGKPTATGTLANEFDFAGQQTDATDLQYLRARYMDPETGVFISRDPLADSAGWAHNPLAYADASPCSKADPSGLSPAPPQRKCDDIWSGLVGALTEVMKRAAQWYVGDNGKYDYSGGSWTPASQEFRTRHYGAYEDARRGTRNRMAEWHSRDDCKNGPKPPYFDDYWKLGEYFRGKTLDEAADDLRDGKTWVKSKLFQSEVAIAVAAAIAAAGGVAILPPSGWRPPGWTCPAPGQGLPIPGC